VTTKNLKLITRHIGELEVEQYILPESLETNFHLPLQTLQKSIDNLDSLLKHEKYNLPSKFQDFHLHPVVNWSIIIIVIIIIVIITGLSITVYYLFKQLKRKSNPL